MSTTRSRLLAITTDITSRKCFATGCEAILAQETSGLKWKRGGPLKILFFLHNVQFGEILRCLFGSDGSYPLYFHRMVGYVRSPFPRVPFD